MSLHCSSYYLRFKVRISELSNSEDSQVMFNPAAKRCDEQTSASTQDTANRMQAMHIFIY